MPIFGLMSTDNSPISTAPTVEPGLRQYSPSCPVAGWTVREGSAARSVSRSVAESRCGSLSRYSRRSIRRVIARCCPRTNAS